MQKCYAGIGSKTAIKATGKPFDEWNKILDKFDVKKNGHTKTARYLREAHKQSPWWSQVITVRYEYLNKLRS